MKSRLTEIGWAVCDLIDAYNAAAMYNKIHDGAIRNPVAYALYQTWKKYDGEDSATANMASTGVSERSDE